MAITYNGVLTKGANTTTSITTASITPTANRLVVLMYHARNCTNASPTVSGCNLTWTKISITSGVQSMGLYIGVGSSPTTGTVSVTSLTSATENGWIICEFTGANNSSPVVQSLYESETGNPFSITLPSAFASGSAAIGFSARSAVTTATAGSGFTLIDQQQTANRTIAAEYQLNKTDDTIVDMTFASGGGGNNYAFELAVASSTVKQRRSLFKPSRIGSRGVL